MMKYEWTDEYFLSKKGVIREFKIEWNVVRYMLRDKMIAMQGGDKDNNPILTLKLEPFHGELLRKKYKDIKPGYYMNKTHWNSIYLKGEVPNEVVKDMIDETYLLILSSFSKRVQNEI